MPKLSAWPTGTPSRCFEIEPRCECGSMGLTARRAVGCLAAGPRGLRLIVRLEENVAFLEISLGQP